MIESTTASHRPLVSAIQRAYKHATGGSERYDMDWYDREVAECTRLAKVLGTVVIPPDASLDEARAEARKALAAHRTPDNEERRALARQFVWAQAVVEGDARQYWSPYHPRYERTAKSLSGT